MVLFGRRGKAFQCRSNLSQFSGFVWHENEEKQRAKIKEKLDKFVKDKLFEFCDLLDIPLPKATSRKEDIVARLVDFMAAPHLTTDVLLSDIEQLNKSKKRKRTVQASAPKKSDVTPRRSSGKKPRRGEDPLKSKEKSESESDDEPEKEKEEDEDNENGVPDEDDEEASEHSESEKKEQLSEEEEDEEESGKARRGRKKSTKRGSAGKGNMKKVVTSPKKSPPSTSAKSSSKLSYGKRSKSEKPAESSPRVFSRKKKMEDTPKKKPSSSSKSASKEKSGKSTGRRKSKSRNDGPSEDELRRAICDILKEVDFNTATFTDILKQLASQFEVDLMPRKSAIKGMIQDELTKLADEADSDSDDEEGGDDDKDENPEDAD